MRRLELKHRKGYGFDLYEVDGAERKLLSEGLAAVTLWAFFLEGARLVGDKMGRNLGALVSLLQTRKVA